MKFMTKSRHAAQYNNINKGNEDLSISNKECHINIHHRCPTHQQTILMKMMIVILNNESRVKVCHPRLMWLKPFIYANDTSAALTEATTNNLIVKCHVAPRQVTSASRKVASASSHVTTTFTIHQSMTNNV